MFVEAPDRFSLVTSFNPALRHMHTLVASFRGYALNFTGVYTTLESAKMMLHDVKRATEVLQVVG